MHFLRLRLRLRLSPALALFSPLGAPATRTVARAPSRIFEFLASKNDFVLFSLRPDSLVVSCVHASHIPNTLDQNATICTSSQHGTVFSYVPALNNTDPGFPRDVRFRSSIRHQKSSWDARSVNRYCADAVERVFRACARNVDVGNAPSTIDPMRSVYIRQSVSRPISR